MSLDFIRVGDKELSPGQKPVDCCQHFSFIILMIGALLWDEILFNGADTKQESVNFKFQSNWWIIRLKFLGKLILKIEKNTSWSFENILTERAIISSIYHSELLCFFWSQKEAKTRLRQVTGLGSPWHLIFLIYSCQTHLGPQKQTELIVVSDITTSVESKMRG